MDDQGLSYTRGSGFRARAEARQRAFRARRLKCGWRRYGHLLDEAGCRRGDNFLHPAALAAARQRLAAGKGVSYSRTFGNMLSSQALCFNIFAPLAADHEGRALAAAVLAEFIPYLEAVEAINIEYTPDRGIFRDQAGRAGVDCDLLIRYRTNRGDGGVLVVEVKYVEPGFSVCGHCRPGKADPCPPGLRLAPDFANCRYASRNGYLYWRRALEQDTLELDTLPDRGCPFRGELWQLWVNHTLAHVLAHRQGLPEANFALLAPADNDRLLAGGLVPRVFARHLRLPETFLFIALERLLNRLRLETIRRAPEWRRWADRLCERYHPAPVRTEKEGEAWDNEGLLITDAVVSGEAVFQASCSESARDRMDGDPREEEAQMLIEEEHFRFQG